jgi:molecular chaperone DnaJ
VQRLRGEGPPKLGSSSDRGDIHYRFVIDVPKHLSQEQQDAVDALSRTLEGDPRGRLFPNGSGPSSSEGATQDAAEGAGDR